MVDHFHGLIYRDASVEGDNIKTEKNGPRVQLDVLELLNKGSRVFNEGPRMTN